MYLPTQDLRNFVTKYKLSEINIYYYYLYPLPLLSDKTLHFTNLTDNIAHLDKD